VRWSLGRDLDWRHVDLERVMVKGLNRGLDGLVDLAGAGARLWRGSLLDLAVGKNEHETRCLRGKG
jgi:hypothetical protein